MNEMDDHVLRGKYKIVIYLCVFRELETIYYYVLLNYKINTGNRSDTVGERTMNNFYIHFNNV